MEKKQGADKLNLSKIITIFIFLTTMGVMMVPLAHAEVVRTIEQEIEIRLESAYKGTPGGVHYNIVEEKYTEPATWPIGVRGKYWGPYIPASISSLGVGEVVSFSTVIPLGTDVLAGGASEYWVRIPLQGTTVEEFGLRINDVDMGRFHRSKYQGGLIRWDNRGIFLLWQTPLNTFERNGFHTFEVYNAMPFAGEAINFLWTPEEYLLVPQWTYITTHDGGMYSFDTGVFFAWAFVFLRGVCNTGAHLYTFRQDFTTLHPWAVGSKRRIVLEEDTSPFDIFYRNWGGGIVNNITFLDEEGTPTIAIRLKPSGAYETPSTATFLGAGTEVWMNLSWEGWHNYDTERADDGYIDPSLGRHIYKEGIITDFGANKYISLYMPFRGTTKFDLVLATNASTPDETIHYLRTEEHSDYLIYTFPTQYSNGGNDLSYKLWMIPHNTIQLYGYSSSLEEQEYLTGVSKRGYYDYTTTYYSFSGEAVTDRYEPVDMFLHLEQTDGVITEIVHTPDYDYYNWGWGEGYVYPGDITLYIVLDNITEMVFSGRTETLYDVDFVISRYTDPRIRAPIAAPSNIGEVLSRELLTASAEGFNLGKAITGAIYTIYEYMHSMLTTIYHVLVDFITRAIAFLEEIVTYLMWQAYGLVITGATAAIMFFTSIMVTHVEGGSDEAIEGESMKDKFYEKAAHIRKRRVEYAMRLKRGGKR